MIESRNNFAEVFTELAKRVLRLTSMAHMTQI